MGLHPTLLGGVWSTVRLESCRALEKSLEMGLLLSVSCGEEQSSGSMGACAECLLSPQSASWSQHSRHREVGPSSLHGPSKSGAPGGNSRQQDL